MYFCGPTVYQRIHIGNARPFVLSLWLKRWLERSGYQVTLAENITDINDKIYRAAPGDSARLAADATGWYLGDTGDLGLGRPDVEPKATESIPEIVAMIAQLVESGHAYPAVGDVYFRVSSFPDYGRLSGRHGDEEATRNPSEEPEEAERKEDPRDFALWKGHKEGEDTSWESPWGRGRPGWHIECSAMAETHLGPVFEIHGGGIDLVFPHHENEVAQSRAAGLPFARYWVHNGLLNLGAAKMGKSTGNVIDMATITAMGIRPIELRYYLLAAHYRSVIDFSEAALENAASAFQRIEGFVTRAVESVGTVEPGPLPAEFAAAMDDDLNTSGAVAVLHDAVTAGNTALAEGGDVAGALAAARAMLGVLGLDPLDPQWTVAGTDDLRSTVDNLVALALEQRQLARDRRDWSAADAVRDQLKHAGVIVEDTPQGPRWSVAHAG